MSSVLTTVYFVQSLFFQRNRNPLLRSTSYWLMMTSQRQFLWWIITDESWLLGCVFIGQFTCLMKWPILLIWSGLCHPCSELLSSGTNLLQNRKRLLEMWKCMRYCIHCWLMFRPLENLENIWLRIISWFVWNLSSLYRFVKKSLNQVVV